eukprot:CAMPEP_0198227448 /NCGR_PEP_ID=MMETSP1445-20131203/109251_1 /TAXON_ID=36898 /ORGANISM="Pyramimonas sp., Strain CCMP2087" /LENGTH=49 /DNA_ID=CAMNT_0043907509 /DNA_START=294 /DNA_END=443 /DNA_ORIENTATION=-
MSLIEDAQSLRPYSNDGKPLFVKDQSRNVKFKKRALTLTANETTLDSIA